ncbi:uncharacterized protein LOC107646513 [Arachis ipaensis]|uniref:uncharacterized protein LOC107646513 n=1 Tax=Arachis ipaensis TaxID=130454 RepID=UPI0007AF239A|nr:uncharacterized protein LOC107646513 [Arachis ipaensis]
MSGVGGLMGPSHEHQPTVEEQDQLKRSIKKVRKDGEGFTGTQLLLPRDEEWMRDSIKVEENFKAEKSFAQMVRGGPTKDQMEEDIVELGKEGNISSEDDKEEKEHRGEETDTCNTENIRVEKTKEGLYNIVISNAIERDLWKPWLNTLIAKLMGRRVGYAAIKRRLETMWSKTVDVIDLSNDFYLVKFYASEDFDFALMDGPWKVYDHYLTVRLWEPNFNPLRATIDKITAWVRLPDLPIELYDRTILRRIGNLIGRMVKVDNNTANLCREKFARLCVEVDLTKPLMGKYLFNGEEYHVEYEGIHQICFSCGRIDHDQQHCNIRKEKEVAARVENSEQSTYENEEN